MKEIGTLKAAMAHGLTDVPAYKLGKYWGVNRAELTSPYYTVTHLPTGRAIVTYMPWKRAAKLAGILDTLIPAETEGEVFKIWREVPIEVRKALVFENS